MKIRLGLSIRMVLLIITSAIVIYSGTIKIIGIYYEKTAFAETKVSNDNQSVDYAMVVKSLLDSDLNKLRAFANIIEQNGAENYEENSIVFNQILSEILEASESFLAANCSWELSVVDSNWTLSHGRISHTFVKTQWGIEEKVDSLDLLDDNYDSQYFFCKIVPEEIITDPFWFSYTGKNSDKKLQSNLMVPLSIHGDFAGVVELSIDLEYINSVVDSLSSTSSYDVSIFSFNGDIIDHDDKKILGQNIVEVDTFLTSRFNMLDRIQSGEQSSFLIQDRYGKDSSYFTLYSFRIGQTNTPWAVLITAPLSDIKADIKETLAFANLVGYIGLGVLALVIVVFSINLVKPLRGTTQVLDKLAKGEVHGVSKVDVKTNDEIGEIGESTNTLIDRLNQITYFAEEIGKGNFSSEIALSGDRDILGKSVIDMRNSLEVARKDELVRIQEKNNLNWGSEGINLFNRILRVDNQDLKQLTYDIIKNITTYLSAHMGGIYIRTNEKSDEYELVSYIGFSKEKYSQQIISTDESNVGRCILEKETIFMNDVPDDYSKITSGLGNAKPVSILIVPLLYNEELVGILEIESLKNIEQYQIEFVEKLADNIASTVASVKINVRTSDLLSNSQKQAEELEQQEEEMRQNMEEMQATQEEAKKQEDDLVALIDGYNHILLFSEYDTKERLTDINENYLKLYKTAKSQIIGKQHKADLFMDEGEKVKQKEFWDTLRKGETQESVEYIKSGKEDYWILEKFVPIKDKYGIVGKILCIGFDITKQKKIDSQLNQITEGNYTRASNNVKTNAPSIDLNQKLEEIDLTYLKMVYKKDPQKIYNIVKLYYDTLPLQLRELEEVCNEGDYVKLKSKINSLKTKMSYLGLKKIYEEFRNVERFLAEDKNLIELPQMLTVVFDIWASASHELEVLLKINK